MLSKYELTCYLRNHGLIVTGKETIDELMEAYQHVRRQVAREATKKQQKVATPAA